MDVSIHWTGLLDPHTICLYNNCKSDLLYNNYTYILRLVNIFFHNTAYLFLRQFINTANSTLSTSSEDIKKICEALQAMLHHFCAVVTACDHMVYEFYVNAVL